MESQKLIYHKFPEVMREKEIYDFMYNLFEFYEIRAKVGKIKNIVFEIRTKENGHNIPHVHAKYENLNISISLINFEILAGNLPHKNEMLAVHWVKDNADMLCERWKDYNHVFEYPVFGMSRLT